MSFRTSLLCVSAALLSLNCYCLAEPQKDHTGQVTLEEDYKTCQQLELRAREECYTEELVNIKLLNLFMGE